MGLYSEKLLSQLQQIGQPLTSKTVTSTTGMDQNQGLDLPSLIMMLYFSDAFKGGKGNLSALMPPGGFGAASGVLGGANAPSQGLPMGGFGGMGAASTGMLPGGFTLESLFRMLGGK